MLKLRFPLRPGVYILIGAGSLVMLVGFFGCCGAVRESQCLLGSVSTSVHKRMSENRTCLLDIYLHSGCFSVLCMFIDHLWSRGGSGGVRILKQRQGTFISFTAVIADMMFLR